MRFGFFDLNWKLLTESRKSEWTFTWITPCKPTGAARGKEIATLALNSVGVELLRSSCEAGVSSYPELRLSACTGLSIFTSIRRFAQC